MPELPEVETTKKSLQPLLNKTISAIDVYQPKLRWPIPSNLTDLTGFYLQQVQRRAKYLILTFKANSSFISTASTAKTNTAPTRSLIIHLGMSGSLQQYPAGSDKRKHDHLIFHFNGAGADENKAANHNPATLDSTLDDTLDNTLGIQLHYHDPRRFGAVLWYDDYADKLLTHLGVEPLEAHFNGTYLYNRIHKTAGDTATPLTTSTSKRQKPNSSKPIARPIKAVIMDQAFVVGVGNIYATESLFLSGIHPSTAANLLTKQQLSTLVAHIISILQRAIEQGGSTLKDFTVGGGSTGYFQQTLNVYGKHKAPCSRCTTPIDKVIISGRASTFCPNCQPLVEDSNGK